MERKMVYNSIQAIDVTLKDNPTKESNMATQQKKEPTQLIVDKEHFKQTLLKRIEIGYDIYNSQIQSSEQLASAKSSNADWNSYNSELLKQSFNKENNEYRSAYDDVNFYYRNHDGRKNELMEFREKHLNKLTNLKQLLSKVDLMKSQLSNPINTAPLATQSDTIKNNNVFIVHGHNNEIKANVARTLEKLGLNPIILHEQANSGNTIIEKFEKHSDVGFAIILLTDDDLGKAKNEENLNPRSRQNVILEMGYFIGRHGRERVCPLYTKGVELPSDLYGLLYTEIDNSEHWKIKIAKELKAAGYAIDLNKII
jgi:predicted nucleotide-binding protein